MVYLLHTLPDMEVRRQNDIVAFKWQGEAPVAFHTRNLEVAEVSEAVWESMQLGSENQALLDWNEQHNPEVKSGKVEFGIRSLTINVTQICNLKCTYCAAGGDGTYGAAQTKISVEQTLPQLKFFLDQLSDGQSFKIVFLGGEPLLYPEGIRAISSYVKLMTAGRNIKAHFSIVTNGTLFSDQNLDLLQEVACNITVSIDGPAYINDAVRPLKGGKGSTDLVVEGLRKLFSRKASLGEITLHGVFHEGNMNLAEAYKFYQQFPADHYEFTYGVGTSNPDANSNFIEQMEQVATDAYGAGGEDQLRKINFFDGVFSALDSQKQTENFCGSGKSFLVVDARNKIFTCPWDVGQNSESVGQGANLDRSKLESYSKPLIDQNNCGTCWARYMCGGGCMFIHKQHSGSKNIKDKEFCRRTQSLISLAILFYKKSRQFC